MGGFAWVTLATNDSYSLGALVLAHSLKQVGTAHRLAVLVTPGVTNVMRKNLADAFDVVEEVNLFDSKDEANLRLLKRPELGVTFTKLHCWRLTQFEKCVFLDADVLVLVNADELFERDEFSAAPDVGWPDCFNSGVFVYRPSMETYNKLVDFAVQKGSFDGGDQGLLNAFFSDWAHKDISKHLPFIYNMCSTACYSYLPAFKFYGANVKIVHFIGPAKPWLQYFDTETRTVHPSSDLQHLGDVLQRWWNIFCSLIHPKLTPDMAPRRQNAESHYPQSHNHNPHQHTSYFQSSDFEDQSRDQTKNDVYNVWDPWEEYEKNHDATPSDHHKEHVTAGHDYTTSNDHGVPAVNNCDIPLNLSDSNRDNNQEDVLEIHTPITRNISGPVEPSHTHEIFKENVVENVFSANTSEQNKTEYQTAKDNASIPDRLDNLSRIHVEHQEPISSSHNILNPIPTTSLPAQIHSLTELSMSNVPETSANNSQDASCSHTKVYDDADNKLEQSGLAGAFAQFTLGAKRSETQDALENHLRRQAWEVGNIDYMGRDSFDNIWSKICETLSTTTIDDGAVSSPESQQIPASTSNNVTDISTRSPKLINTSRKEPPQPSATEVPKSAEETRPDATNTEAKDEAPTSTTVSAEPPTQAVPVEEAVPQQQTVPPDVIPQPEPVAETPEKATTQEEISQPPQAEAPTTVEQPQSEEQPTPVPEEVKSEGTIIERPKVEQQPDATAPAEEPKVESQPEAAVLQDEPKAEATPSKEDSKAESQPEVAAPKGEPKIEPPSEIVAPKAEPQPEVVAVKAEPQPEVLAPKVEPQPEVVASKVEPQPEVAAPKAVQQPEVVAPKAEPQPEVETPKVEPQPEVAAPQDQPKAESEVVAAKEEPKTELESEVAAPKEEPKAASQPEAVAPETEPQPEVAASKEDIKSEVPPPKEEPKIESKPVVPTEEVKPPASPPKTEIKQAKPAPKPQEVPLPKDEAKPEQTLITSTEAKIPEPVVLKEETSKTESVTAAKVPPRTKPVEKRVDPPKEEVKQTKESVKPKPPKLETAAAKGGAASEAVKLESPKSPDSPKEEAEAEGSSQTPKSDTKPKEVKKIKKKVKKSPKGESGDTPDAAKK